MPNAQQETRPGQSVYLTGRQRVVTLPEPDEENAVDGDVWETDRWQVVAFVHARDLTPQVQLLDDEGDGITEHAGLLRPVLVAALAACDRAEQLAIEARR